MALEIAPIERSRVRVLKLGAFFSQLVLERKLESIKVMPYWGNHGFPDICCTETKDMCDSVSINQPLRQQIAH